VVPLHYTFRSILDFVDVQSRNISRTGMFVQTETRVAIGGEITFEFGLVDGFTLLKGRGRVVRAVTAGPINGLGVEFLELEDSMRRLIDRIVEVNATEGRSASVGFDFSRPSRPSPPPTPAPATPRATAPPRAIATAAPPAQAGAATAHPAAAPPSAITPSPGAPPGAALASRPGPAATAGSVAGPHPGPPPDAPAVGGAGAAAGDAGTTPLETADGVMRIVLSAATAPYFTSNPLLNARVGGFFAPAAGDPPLGGVFTVAIVAVDGSAILESGGKVVAKQDVRIGVRLTDPDKASLDRLRSALAKLIPAAGK
jgi:Tfp pilus assembly protein PilZ